MVKTCFVSGKSINNKCLISLWRLYNCNFRFSRWTKGYFFSFVKYPAILYSIKVDKELAGFICGKPEAKSSKRYIISALLIKKKFRGKGYAESLVKKAIESISETRKFESIGLHFRDSNNLKNFYKKIGFKNHKITGTYSNGEKKHFMEMNL